MILYTTCKSNNFSTEQIYCIRILITTSGSVISMMCHWKPKKNTLSKHYKLTD